MYTHTCTSQGSCPLGVCKNVVLLSVKADVLHLSATPFPSTVQPLVRGKMDRLKVIIVFTATKTFKKSLLKAYDADIDITWYTQFFN